jgi:hypothetical protein
MASGQQCVNVNRGKRSHVYITHGANYSSSTQVANPITDSLNASVTFNGHVHKHTADATTLIVELTRNHDALADRVVDILDGAAGLLTITLTNPTAPAPVQPDPVNVTYVNDPDAAP